MFQRRLLFGHAQRSVKHQRLRIAQVPDRRAHLVLAEPAQGGDAFEAVDDLIVVGLPRDRDDDDRYLLSRFGQRRQQLLLALQMTRPQVFVSQVQLMELKIHPIPPGVQERKFACTFRL